MTILARSVARGLLQVTTALATVSGLAACASAPDTAELRIKVLDPAGSKPLAGAIVAMEVGGLYVTNDDPSRGNPSFVHGARTNEQGTLRLTLSTDDLGVHSFVGGYFYGARLVELDQDLGITIFMAPFASRDPAPVPPSISNERLDPAIVAPSGAFTVSATVAAGDPSDPLSEEVLFTCPAQIMSRALDPPSRGVPGKMYPDGLWSRTLTAPDDPGRYDCYLSATTEGCVTGDIKLLVLEVQ